MSSLSDYQNMISAVDSELKQLKADNTRLREALKRIATGYFQWRNDMVQLAYDALSGPEGKLSISPDLMMSREETGKSALSGPSGARMAWDESGPEGKVEAPNVTEQKLVDDADMPKPSFSSLEAENARLREAVERNILPKCEEFNPPAPAMKAFQVYAKTVIPQLMDENTRLREALKRIATGNFQWRNKMVEIAIAALAGPEKGSEAGDE